MKTKQHFDAFHVIKTIDLDWFSSFRYYSPLIVPHIFSVGVLFFRGNLSFEISIHKTLCISSLSIMLFKTDKPIFSHCNPLGSCCQHKNLFLTCHTPNSCDKMLQIYSAVSAYSSHAKISIAKVDLTTISYCSKERLNYFTHFAVIASYSLMLKHT